MSKPVPPHAGPCPTRVGRVVFGHIRHLPDSPAWQGEHLTGPGVALGFARTPVEVRYADGWVLGTPNAVFLNNPDDVYARRRIHPAGEDTTWIRYPLDDGRDVVRAHDPHVDDRGDRVLRRSLGPCPTHAFVLERRLQELIRAGRTEDAVAIEETAFAVLDEVVGASHGPDGDARPRRLPPRQREQVHAAIRHMLDRPQARIQVTDLTRVASMSRPTLYRVFRQVTGMPLHRYLTRIRLRRAFAVLADGGGDLTRVALDHGFSSHAHFTTTFGREFGMPPSVLSRTNGGTSTGCDPRNEPPRPRGER